MILATSEDYEYPHIDWHCKECGEVYCYAGYPDESRCLQGHGAGWRPEDEQVEAYIEFLESLEPGDGIVLCGHGPAPLMAPVDSVGDGQLTTEAIDSPARVVRWDEGSEEEDGEPPTVEFGNAEEDHLFWNDVYHVESVEIRTAAPATGASDD